MAIFEDDSEVGTITIAVVLATLAIGAVLYATGGPTTVQTASRFPIIDKTVPTIVPSEPQI